VIGLVNDDEEWRRKGATLNDKSARKEFGLSQEEVVDAIDAGKLSHRIGVIHGNPWFRLLRREVEELMNTTYNDQPYGERRARAELACDDHELKQLRTQLALLEAQRAELVAELPG
jgi:hypothetical protein